MNFEINGVVDEMLVLSAGSDMKIKMERMSGFTHDNISNIILTEDYPTVLDCTRIHHTSTSHTKMLLIPLFFIL